MSTDTQTVPELAAVSRAHRMTVTMDPLTEEELDAVTVVFHQYETGLREGTIMTRVSLDIFVSILRSSHWGGLHIVCKLNITDDTMTSEIFLVRPNSGAGKGRENVISSTVF